MKIRWLERGVTEATDVGREVHAKWGVGHYSISPQGGNNTRGPVPPPEGGAYPKRKTGQKPQVQTQTTRKGL